MHCAVGVMSFVRDISSGSLASIPQCPSYDNIDDVLEVLLSDLANESSSSEVVTDIPAPTEVDSKTSRK